MFSLLPLLLLLLLLSPLLPLIPLIQASRARLSGKCHHDVARSARRERRLLHVSTGLLLSLPIAHSHAQSATTTTTAQTHQTAPVLRIAIFENLDYPLSIYDAQHQLIGGVQKEFADRIARSIGADAIYLPYSRRRIEQVIISGEADLLCYTSPQWSDKPDAMQWSIPSLPQLERVVVLASQPVPEQFARDLPGKRMAVQIGYHYPTLTALFDSGQTTRVDMTDVPSMFRMLERGGADALISSESEIEGFFKRFPEKRTLFKISHQTFSLMQTQCALSKKSGWKIDAINQAIRRMQNNGELTRMMRRYGLSDH
ncbi:substrate-binding periplasmic protein [Undibacterium sp. SXout7W]|uniref:substrate-binding periplasmic protein n=1 Tax=Undibacterium sp. SXout7W TaxID=3413049 RepID=UPI003BEFD8B6